MTWLGVGGVVSRKWKSIQPEISVARISCLTSGSFRPKLGLFILSLVLIGCCIFVVIPLVSSPTLISSASKQTSRRFLTAPIMEIKNKEAVSAVAAANTKFGAKLYGELMKSKSAGDNLILSPFSISAVVSMALTGAKGSTADQIRAGLSLPADEHLLAGYEEALATLASNENFTLDAANKLYVQDGFKLLDSFLQTTSKHFHAEAEATNFGDGETARALINGFVEQKTNGKIKDLIQSGVLTALTRLVLINAIYFKGDWAQKFKPDMTRKANFHLSDGSTVEADMMYINDEFRLANLKDIDAKALEMPYKGDRLSMIFVLPQESLAKTESALAGFDFNAIQFGPRTKVDVHIPKFKIESTHELNEPLKGLGLTDMFDETKADFSGISDVSELYVSKVVQKAFIEVNEEGSEAAAATGMVMMTRMMVVHPLFRCDKPFLFYIKDRLTGLILFAGKIENPTKN